MSEPTPLPAARTVVAGFLTPRQNGKTRAALAEAHERGVRRGVLAERARIRAGVEALDGDYSCDIGSHLDVGAVLAVIDGEGA